MREEYVGALYGLAIFVGLHVERLDFLGIISEDDGLLEVFFHEITLVFGSQVATPRYGELKLLTFCHSSFKQCNTFCVSETHKFSVNYRTKTLKQRIVDHLVEEFEIFHAVIECPTHAILDEVFFQIHQSLEIHESNFWLNHPELCQVARSVGVFSTEGWTKSVDGTQSGRTQLTFELTRHSETSRFSKEII